MITLTAPHDLGMALAHQAITWSPVLRKLRKEWLNAEEASDDELAAVEVDGEAVVDVSASALPGHVLHPRPARRAPGCVGERRAPRRRGPGRRARFPAGARTRDLGAEAVLCPEGQGR